MLSLLLIFMSAFADPGCHLTSREGDNVMAGLPADIVGWVVCPQNDFSRLNSLFVARPESLDFMKRYDEAMVPGGQGYRLAGKADGVAIYHSRRELDAFVHLVFEQDGLIFAYTDTPERAKKYRAQFLALKQTLSSAEWRKRLGAL